MGYRRAKISYKGHRIAVEIADSYLKHMNGLMSRESMGKNSGMLFVFDREARHGIWMFKMRFPIDIIWIAKDHRIVDIAKDAKPMRGMLDYKIFKPKENARYVLEVNSGVATSLKMRVGEGILFPASVS